MQSFTGVQTPGGAFSSSFAETMQQEAATKRQAMLDDLTRRHIESQIAEGQAALNEKKQEHADTLTEKERNQTVTDVAGLVPGDIPDAELVARAKKHHVPLRTSLAEPPQGAMPPASLATPGIPPVQDPAAVTPLGTGVLATPPQGSIRFAGTPAQQAVIDQRQRAQAFIDTLPDTDPRKQELKNAFEAEAAGLKVPPGYFAKQTVAKPHVVFDPIHGTYKEAGTGRVITDPKELEGVTPDRLAEPRDTSGREVVQAMHLQTERNKAFVELNNDAKPVEDTINRVNRTLTSLNQNSNIADSTLAEMIVTMTAGGQGSGVRISQPMINQVLSKGRTHWSDLDLALRRWEAADPTKKQDASLFFTDDQRQAIRTLAQAYRKEANRVHAKITASRHAIDDAESIADVNKIRTRAQEDIFAPAEPEAPPASSGLPAGVTVTKRAQ